MKSDKRKRNFKIKYVLTCHLLQPLITDLGGGLQLMTPYFTLVAKVHSEFRHSMFIYIQPNCDLCLTLTKDLLLPNPNHRWDSDVNPSLYYDSCVLCTPAIPPLTSWRLCSK